MIQDIPEQATGVQTNTEYTITTPNHVDAIELFESASAKLLDVNNWNHICGAGSADFQLVNHQGEEVYRPAKLDDYFKIDIPGPGTVSGEGYDWVIVEKIEDASASDKDEQRFIMQVRPCSNPHTKNNDTSHFLSDEATSTFSIMRKNNTITASVFGRNEKPNTGAGNVVDKIRNTVVGTGAVAGASKIQWTMLVKGLLK